MTPREAFFNKYLQTAKSVTNGTKIYPAVVLSVAALESGNGLSELTRKANNFFGMKAGYVNDAGKWIWSKGWNESNSHKIASDEEKNGTTYKEVSWFRKYDLPIHSFADYVRLINTAARYEQARKATNALDQVEAIKAAGYATDSNYVNKVATVLDTLKNWVDTLKKKALSDILGEQYYCFWGVGISLK